MNEEDARKLEESRQAVAELREWMVRFDVNQEHQTNLLEKLVLKVDKAIESADKADEKAEKADAKAQQALALAEQTLKDLDKYKDDEKTHKRWLIGLLVPVIVTIGIALLNIYI